MDPIVISDDLTDFKIGKSDRTRNHVNSEPKEPIIKEKHVVRQVAESRKPKSSEKSQSDHIAERTKQAVVTSIPETQVLFTPPGANVGKRGKDGVKDSPDISDFGLIPDTPQDKKDEVVKTKRPLGRSFLLSAAQMGTNPIQKAKEHRQEKLAMKKKMSMARKSLVSVSVEFNPDKKDASKTPSEQLISSDVGKVSGIETNKTSDSGEMVSQVGEEHSDKILVCDGKTPTKIYSEGNTIKRMAKSGISPDSKRSVGDTSTKVNAGNESNDNELTSMGHSVCKLNFGGNTDRHVTETTAVGETSVPVNETDFKSAKTLLEDKDIVKSKEDQIRIERKKRKERELKLKQERELLEKKRVAKEENRRKSEKLLKYQLTGDTGKNTKQFA